MTDKHTPGPWKVAGDDINGQAIVRGEHVEIATCWHHCLGSLEIQMRANARLIAAAPELLEACQTLATLLDTDDWIATGRLAVKQAQAAIAKVRGTQ
jgi:hypothetical protein